MSRSRKHTPIIGLAPANSEAQDKRLWHRAYRRCEKARIALEDDPLPADKAQYSNPWAMDKDGKIYWPHDPKLLRK